jgi:asparagine synthase (glutamine-hydrolysing)
VAVVLNGEIYNYLELREELIARGHSFGTVSDTETIAHLYEELGPRLVDRLRGMFAFALWDSRRRRLILARDRVGKKPLFYRATETTLWFASELRALLVDPEVPRDVDVSALDSYLRFQYVPHPLSAFDGIQKVPPAHLVTWDGGEPLVSRYWRLAFAPEVDCSMAEAGEIVRESLLEATRLRLRADVPIGAFLSGGVDSSAVVAAMAQQSAEQVRTFSIGFADSRYDETPFARQVAARYGTDHHELRVEADAIGILPRLVWHYGEPFADSSALPSFYLAELTRRHVTVALNGDGGDENFAGYRRYVAQAYTDRLSILPSSIRRGIAKYARAISQGAGRETFRGRAARALGAVAEPPSRRYDRWMSCFTREQLQELYDPAFADLLPDVGAADAMIVDPWMRSNAPTTVGVLLDVDIQTYLPGDLLVKMDIASMAHSLEVRSPFLDHVLMERAARLPARLKLRGRTSKALLKDAVRPWLPEAVVDRAKMGFGAPIAEWFRGSLSRLPDDVLLDPQATGRGMFRTQAVERLITDHRSGARDNSAKLWALLQLELWLRTYVDCVEPTEQTLDAVP